MLLEVSDAYCLSLRRCGTGMGSCRNSWKLLLTQCLVLRQPRRFDLSFSKNQCQCSRLSSELILIIVVVLFLTYLGIRIRGLHTRNVRGSINVGSGSTNRHYRMTSTIWLLISWHAELAFFSRGELHDPSCQSCPLTCLAPLGWHSSSSQTTSSSCK